MKETKQIILVHLFLNLYLLAIVQPLYPILEYVIHYDYIVEKLCENRDKPVLDCNGKCYLGKQLTSDVQQSKQDPVPLPPLAEFDKLLTIRTGFKSYSLFHPDLAPDTPTSYSGLKGTDLLNQVFRPPIL